MTVLQFVENLTGRQAADAVRARIDWKYALSLELSDSGFGHTVLTGFRQRLIDHGLEERALDLLLARCQERGLLKARGRQRTDSTQVLAARQYRLPAFADIPRTEVHFISTTDAIGPLGAKSMNESPFNPVAPALTNALGAATGIRFTELPLTSDRIWLVLDQARRFAGE